MSEDRKSKDKRSEAARVLDPPGQNCVVAIPESDRLHLENLLLKKQAIEAHVLRFKAELRTLELTEQQFHAQVINRLGLDGTYHVDLQAGTASRVPDESRRSDS